MKIEISNQDIEEGVIPLLEMIQADLVIGLLKNNILMEDALLGLPRRKPEEITLDEVESYRARMKLFKDKADREAEDREYEQAKAIVKAYEAKYGIPS